MVGAIYVLAGTVKGVIGMGMPTVAMALLAIVIAPVDAAAIMVLPALVTNLWQMLAGPYLRALTLRLWPMLAGVVVGTLAGTGWLAGIDAGVGRALLGVTIGLYGLSGLRSLRVAADAASERWLGPLAGGLTGMINAATGVSVIPAVPYLQAIGFEKDELVQALGLFFMASTVALGLNLASTAALTLAHGPAATVALVAALAGMRLGQIVRARLDPAAFRRLFFLGLFLLGLALVGRAFV